MLPTDAYIAAGVAVVGLTVLILGLLPPTRSEHLFRPLTLWRAGRRRTSTVWSCGVALALFGLLWLGANGTQDPTRNPLPFAVWTCVWMTGLTVQGLTAGLWRWIDPFTGPLRVIRALGLRPMFHLSRDMGHGLAVISLMGLAALLLVHPAASAPDGLGFFVALHWAGNMIWAVICGPRALHRSEALTVAMRVMGRVAPFGRYRGRAALGLPGWQRQGRADVGLALFMVALLAIGSFDGLYGTYLWLGLIGQNPLEFAGRTAVIVPNAAGLVLAVTLLAGVFALTLAAGRWLAGGGPPLRVAFCTFAPALLPIALGYHVAHFLPVLLVEGQALPNLLTDPLGTHADWLGIGHRPVTTGFFNRLDAVRLIWLVQGGAVVLGHVAAIVMTHRIAQRLYPARGALLAHAPLAAFMVGYTFFGLWLLAAPQGT